MQREKNVMNLSCASGLPRVSIAAASSAAAADKVTFGTNWLAEAEHGGYYQAVADGTYAKYGLDVTILPGGPQANNGLLLVAGKIDFYMGGNLLLGLRRRRAEPADRRRRRAFPEGPADRDVPSRRRARQVGGPAEGDRPSSARRASPRSTSGWSRPTASRRRTSSPTRSTPRRSSPTRIRSSRAM